MTDDAPLIDRALAGDSAAFGQLVVKYQDRLYNTLVHVAGSTDTAYDLAQDAFVQAYLKLDTFKRTSGFYTWLYRIAFNLAISHRRREKPTVSVDHVREATGHEPVDGADGPQACLEQQERAGQLHAALARLSEEHRSILVLREMDDCSYEQIAEILDLPIGTIRSRARLQLRAELQGTMRHDENQLTRPHAEGRATS